MNLTLSKNAAVLISLITGVVEAVVGLLVAFHVNVDDTQRTAIITLVGAVGAATAVIGPMVRPHVYSKDTVQKIVETSYQAGVKGETPPTP